MKPTQISKEIYDIGNTQYSNMPFYDNLNVPGEKIVMFTKRSVDKKCPTQNSLRAPRGMEKRSYIFEAIQPLMKQRSKK